MIHRVRSIHSLATLALVTACGPTSPKGDPTAPTATSVAPGTGPSTRVPATGTANTSSGAGPTAPPPGGPAPIWLPGKWLSPSCATRKYPRELELLDGGRFKADDLVSPCPANVDCVWSGIVHREGAWKEEGKALTLTVDKDGNGPQVAALPASLELPGSELVEVQGSERCSYRKK